MSSQSSKENTEPDNVNVGLIATVTVVGALLVVSTCAALTALVRSETELHTTVGGTAANLGEVARLKEKQHQALVAAPAWSDRALGRVSLPIDRAMQLVSTEVQKNPYLATPLPPKPKDEPVAADGGAPAAPGSAAPEGAAPPAGSGAPEGTPPVVDGAGSAAPPPVPAPAPSASAGTP